MKASEAKAKMLEDLKKQGFDVKKPVYASKYPDWSEARFFTEEIGGYMVYMWLTNQARVFIETSGTGNHYIKLHEYRESFKNTDTKTVVREFKKRVKAVKKLVKDLEN